MSDECSLLGQGAEGIVSREGNLVIKRFRPGVPSEHRMEWLVSALPRLGEHLPGPCTWSKREGCWELSYPWEETESVERLEREPLIRFLQFCLRQQIVCSNFKLANLRLRRGELFFVDVGEWVVPLRASFFRNMCARAYLLATRGLDDEALAKLSPSLHEPGLIESIPGFEPFYREVVEGEARRFVEAAPCIQLAAAKLPSPDVTLLIKACAMDAASIERQVVHLCRQLGRPRAFRESLVVVDPFEGEFLRQHCKGDMGSLLESLAKLRAHGIIDRVLVAPASPDDVSALNQRWFALASEESHTASGVPLQPQLWGFEQVKTRWVLQCDADILVGRRDYAHDYIGDMLRAAAPEDCLGVAFNIEFPAETGFRPYFARPGEFVPEVRCGLLDLERLMALRPLPNRLRSGAPELSWYRSLQQLQVERSLRFPRGGDSRTFYLHPSNRAKAQAGFVDVVRDLVEQDALPAEQTGQWDVVESLEAWSYPRREEPLVFLVMGREIPLAKVERCFRSLLAQDCQDFGVIVVDDGSTPMHAAAVRDRSMCLGKRASLICNTSRQGRLANKWKLVRSLVPRPETLVAVLDMDDHLMHRGVAGLLLEQGKRGFDLVVGGYFRPDKPLKLYPVDFASAPRHRGAGNVWVHLRCFTRSAFDRLRMDDLMIDGHWIPDCSDYATMVPMAVRTSRHSALDGYHYFHERSTAEDAGLRRERRRIIDEVLRRNA